MVMHGGQITAIINSLVQVGDYIFAMDDLFGGEGEWNQLKYDITTLK